jgi:dTDP-4-amino-4,6-dideoxygalactose transaminase
MSHSQGEAVVILQTSPLAGYRARAGEIDEAVARVLRSGYYLLGPETAAFEAEFAAYAGVSHGVGASSGTDALHLALTACGIGPGDEVMTVSHTAVATVAAIDLCGAKPVLVDIDPRSFTLDPARLEAARTERTRAVVPVHLYGQAADLDPIMDFCRRGSLRLIEDCAQAHGALYRGRRVGSFGDAGVFSFYPTKNLGAIGDGGMAVTADPALAAEMRALRQYGWKQTRYVSEVPGWNGRIDELQAAILRVKLRGLDADNDRRRALAAIYAERLADIPGLTLPREMPYGRGVFHQYVVRCARRDALGDALRAGGIQTLVHYPCPVHLQPAYAGRNLASGPMTETENAAREVLSLPMYPELTAAEAERTAEAVRAALAP